MPPSTSQMPLSSGKRDDVACLKTFSYALDYNEYFRDLPHVCVLNEAGRHKFSLSGCGEK